MNPRVKLDPQAVASFCAKWKVRELSLFGSALREDFRDDSDVDFLVSFEPGADWDLWDLVTMREDLMQLAGREVDLVLKDAIRNPYRRREILASRQVVHGA